MMGRQSGDQDRLFYSFNLNEHVPADHLFDPQGSPRAVREYLQALDASAAPEALPKSISLTDPMARWTAAGGPAFFAYSTDYLVDVQAGISVDVEATHAIRTAEVDATRMMLERVEQRFDVKPDRLIADTAYGSAPLLGWLVEEKHIEPHIPVWDKSARQDGTFSRDDFVFNAEQDHYTCPGGKRLTSTGKTTTDNTLLYLASTYDCPLGRRISTRDVAR